MSSKGEKKKVFSQEEYAKISVACIELNDRIQCITNIRIDS